MKLAEKTDFVKSIQDEEGTNLKQHLATNDVLCAKFGVAHVQWETKFFHVLDKCVKGYSGGFYGHWHYQDGIYLLVSNYNDEVIMVTPQSGTEVVMTWKDASVIASAATCGLMTRLLYKDGNQLWKDMDDCRVRTRSFANAQWGLNEAQQKLLFHLVG